MAPQDHAVRMGLHGYGYIGRIHVLASQLCVAAAVPAPRAEWDTVVVRDPESASGRLAAQTFRHVTSDVQEIGRASLDAVSIATPNHLHMAAFEAAAEAGLAVYCEKPISHHLSEAQAMARLAKERGMVEQVALIYRFHPAVMEARRILMTGALGRVLTFRAELLHGGYLDPDRQMAWRLREASAGGGASMDLGIHLIDALHLLLGPVSAVAATARTFVPARSGAGGTESVTVDDWTTCLLEMANGSVGTLEVSRVHVGRERDVIDLVCERGVLHVPLDAYAGASVALAAGGSLPRAEIEEGYQEVHACIRPIGPKYAQSAHLNLHATALAAFLARVRGEEIGYPVPRCLDAVYAQAVVRAMLDSSRQGGRKLDVPRLDMPR
ncbi:Gfo/Idh/MocA family protein [Alicyclobacillus acidiphilus]|uniref:Gfo/Idh/MocA family protein n=1 Tax=Alicyclobacillus acidiphilus TaxID=182455 RepID=UPI000834A011|nr:Gfo/Idh/MocA family oxidoreductase [Alicyclobacillus acidiphilus]